MTFSYSHLPNAVHIDGILESLKNYKGIWFDAHYAVLHNEIYSLFEGAWERSMCTIEYQNNNPKWTGWLTINDLRSSLLTLHGPYICEYSLLALIIFDCAYLLDAEPNEVLLLAKLGIDYAIMMYPAVLAMNMIMELE